jgi:hypothetical protein
LEGQYILDRSLNLHWGSIANCFWSIPLAAELATEKAIHGDSIVDEKYRSPAQVTIAIRHASGYRSQVIALAQLPSKIHFI